MTLTWKHVVIYVVVGLLGWLGCSAYFLTTHEESGDFDISVILVPIMLGVFFLAWPIFLPLVGIYFAGHCVMSLLKKVKGL